MYHITDELKKQITERTHILKTDQLLGLMMETFEYYDGTIGGSDSDDEDSPDHTDKSPLNRDGVYLYQIVPGNPLPHRLLSLPPYMTTADALRKRVKRTLFITTDDEWHDGYCYCVELDDGSYFYVTTTYGSGTLGCCHNMSSYTAPSIDLLLPHVDPHVQTLFGRV